MSVSIVQRLFAFFDNIWSFILTLVRSLLALFSFRRRSSDTFTLPTVNRTPNDALARHLRPILLTQRSVTARAQSTRSRSATSTLFPGHGENATASGSVPQPSGPQRTSPKLDPHDIDVGLSVTIFISETPSMTGSAEGSYGLSPLTTPTDSLSVVPLTPPDTCYITPMPSIIDCPYTEPWPANTTSKPRPAGSPLKTTISTKPEFWRIGSPPPRRWSSIQIWTSTPWKNDNLVRDPSLDPLDHDTRSTADADSVLADISHALMSRSRNSIHPYSDSPGSSPASNASLIINRSEGPTAGTRRQSEPIHEHHRMQARIALPKDAPYPRFHYPDAYASTWRRHGGHISGKSGHTGTHGHSRSYSHAESLKNGWHAASAHVSPPISALSPPLGNSTTMTEAEDEDEIPLGLLKDRIARRNGTASANLAGGGKMSISPKSRRMSEGCLLALYESTPSRIGVGARCSREVLALATNGDERGPKDWLEALSLRFSSEEKEVASEPCRA